MLTLPKLIQIERNKKAEGNLVNKTRVWLEKDSQDRTGIHASDLLDPRKAYYDAIQPKSPLAERLVGLFFVGKVLHAFFLSALTGEKGVNWSSDGGSTVDKTLGISYSPDWCKSGIPGELKTSRSKFEMRPSDLSLYLEQLMIYMVGEDSAYGRLVVLMLNLPAPPGQGWGTYPQYRAYDINVTKAELSAYKKQIISVRKSLERALKTKKAKDIAALPLCRTFKCGKSQCPHYGICKPEGRFGTKRWDK
jgi:hypothetical protein